MLCWSYNCVIIAVNFNSKFTAVLTFIFGLLMMAISLYSLSRRGLYFMWVLRFLAPQLLHNYLNYTDSQLVWEGEKIKSVGEMWVWVAVVKWIFGEVEASKTDNTSISDLSTLGSIFRKASATACVSKTLAWCGHGLRLECILLTTARSRTAISTVVIGSCPHYLWSCFPTEQKPDVFPENDAILDCLLCYLWS